MEFFKLIPQLYDDTRELNIELLQYSVNNSVLPSHVTYRDRTYTINDAVSLVKERSTLEYHNNLYIFMHKGRQALSLYNKIGTMPLLETSDTVVNTYDVELELMASSVDELFSMCRTTNYIPAIWYRDYVKIQRNTSDLSFVCDAKKHYKDAYSNTDMMFYVYAHRNFRVPIEIDKAIMRKHQIKTFIKIYERNHRVYVYLTNVSDFLLSIYKDLISDMLYKNVAFSSHSVKTELQAVRYFKNHTPLNIYTIKRYITSTLELYGYIQPCDTSIKKIKANTQRNFKYRLYMHKYGEKHKPIGLYIYDAMIPEKTLVVQCSYKSLPLINWVFDFINKLLQVIPNVNPSNTQIVESIEKRYAAEPWTDPVYGYSRTCQVSKQPTITDITNRTDEFTNALRKKYTFNHDGKTIMYFRTTDKREHTVDCGKTKFPTLISVKGRYKNVQYPVVPCCITKKDKDEMTRYAAYLGYLDGTVSFEDLYRVYSESSTEHRISKKPLTTMYICSRGQHGILGVRDKRSTSTIPFLHAYTIMKDLIGANTIGRIGVVDESMDQKMRSLIYAVHYAIHNNYKAPTADILKYIEKYIFMCIQELHNISVHDAIEQLKNGHVSAMFYRAIQRYYKCNIHILTYNHDECPNGRIWHPVSPGFMYDFAPLEGPSIFILENYGTEFSQEDYPIYEPMYSEHGVFMHNHDVTLAMSELKEQLYNYTADIPYPVPDYCRVVGMEFDAFNKVRHFTVYNNNTQRYISIYCDPLPSCVLHEYNFQSLPVIRNTEQDVKDYTQHFIKSSASVSRDTDGFTLRLNSLKLYIPFYTGRPSVSTHPFFNNKRTAFDLYSVGRVIADDIKDNILCLFSRYVSKSSGSASTRKLAFEFLNSNILVRRDNIEELVANTQSNKISNVIPSHIASECLYYLLYYSRINTLRDYNTKPNYYNSISKYANRYDVLLPLSNISSVDMFRNMDILDKVHIKPTPFFIQLDLPNMGKSIVMLKLIHTGYTDADTIEEITYKFHQRIAHRHTVNYIYNADTNTYTTMVEPPIHDDSVEVYIYTYIEGDQYYYFLML